MIFGEHRGFDNFIYIYLYDFVSLILFFFRFTGHSVSHQIVYEQTSEYSFRFSFSSAFCKFLDYWLLKRLTYFWDLGVYFLRLTWVRSILIDVYSYNIVLVTFDQYFSLKIFVGLSFLSNLILLAYILRYDWRIVFVTLRLWWKFHDFIFTNIVSGHES